MTQFCRQTMHNTFCKGISVSNALISRRFTKYSIGAALATMLSTGLFAADINNIDIIDDGFGTGVVSIPNLPITTTSDFVSGVSVNSPDGNTVIIEANHSLDITAIGQSASGIYASTGLGNNGDITINIRNGGKINVSGTGPSYGIFARNSGPGNIFIDSNADIGSGPTASTGEARGIVANAVNGNITIRQSGDISANGAVDYNGINASSASIGTVDVSFLSGTINATLAGIWTSAYNSKVTTAAGTQINAGRSSGIFSYNTGNSVYNNKTEIINAAAISSDGYKGIHAQAANDASLFVENSGSIRSKENGIFVKTTSIASVTNTAEISVSGSSVNPDEMDDFNAIFMQGASSGYLTNTGKVQSANGTAIKISSQNIVTTLGTGSELVGNVISDGTGNTLVFQGTVTEDSDFSATSGNKFTKLTVDSQNGNTAWTLNGSNAQLDGVSAVHVENSGTNTATLNITPAGTGAYTFDHELSGSGTLRIARQNATDTISFGSNTGNRFSGKVTLGTGAFNLATGSYNAAAVSGSVLRLEAANVTTITGSVATNALELIGGNGLELVYNTDALLTTNKLYLDAATGKITLNLDDYFSSTKESYTLLSSLFGVFDLNGLLGDAEDYFSVEGGLGGYGLFWSDDGKNLLYGTQSPIPEPSSYAIVFGASALLAIVSRRRRK